MEIFIWRESSCTCNEINWYTNSFLTLYPVIPEYLSTFVTSWLHNQCPYRHFHHCSLSFIQALITKIYFSNDIFLSSFFPSLYYSHWTFFQLFEISSLGKVLFSFILYLFIITSIIIQSDTKIYYFNQCLIKIVNSLLLHSVLMVIHCFKIKWLSTRSLLYMSFYIW